MVYTIPYVLLLFPYNQNFKNSNPSQPQLAQNTGTQLYSKMKIIYVFNRIMLTLLFINVFCPLNSENTSGK